MTENDLHYLRSIHRNLVEIRGALADTAAFSLGGMALDDNIDWLDCFIDQHERASSPPPSAPVPWDGVGGSDT